MARQQGKSVTRTITTTIEKVISDYPLLVLHSAFILGVMLGQQVAKSRFSFMDWAKNALPESPRAMAAALPSFARRSSSARRKPGRRKSTGRQAGQAKSRRQAKMAAAAE